MCSRLDPVYDPHPSNDHASASRLGTTVFACQSTTHACPTTTPLPFVSDTSAYAYLSTTYACPSDPPLDIHLPSCLPTQDPCLSDTAIINKALLSSWTWSADWFLCLAFLTLLLYGSNTYFMWKYDNKYIKFVRCCYSGFFVIFCRSMLKCTYD